MCRKERIGRKGRTGSGPAGEEVRTENRKDREEKQRTVGHNRSSGSSTSRSKSRFSSAVVNALSKKVRNRSLQLGKDSESAPNRRIILPVYVRSSSTTFLEAARRMRVRTEVGR